MPKVSIIMPMLNSIKYLHECMDSVVNQTLKDIEIIPVDAGSTDGTLEVLQEYAEHDKRIKVLQSDKKSMGHQYNLGITAAQGEYVGFVESDDYIVPEMYEILYRYAKKYEVDWVKSNYFYFMDYPQVGRQLMPVNDEKFCSSHEVFEPRFMPRQYTREIFMWRGIYRTKFVKENNIVINETKGASFQDTGFVLQAFMYAEKALYIDDFLYCYRRDNQGSSSHQINTILFEINEVEYISQIIRNNPVLYDLFWNVNYKRALERFKSSYERIPPLQECSEEIFLAVKRYRHYLLEEIENNPLFWLNCDVSDSFKEIVWLKESLICFDKEYRKIEFAKETLLKKTLHNIINYEKVAIFGCGDNGAGIISLLLRLDKNKIVWVSDNDENKWHQNFMGMKIIPPKDLTVTNETIVLVANEKYFYEIKSQLISLGIPTGYIWLCPPIMRFRGTNILLENEVLPLK